MDRINRRDTALALLVLAAAPLGAEAQQKGKVWRIGFLHLASQADVAPSLDAFKQAFRALGYTEGRDYVLELRFADGHLDRLPSLASELVRLQTDVIMAAATSSARAVQKASTTIPIVFISTGDPVGSGLVKSLARPEGNATGTSNSLVDIAPKHLGLLRDTVPGLSRLAVLINSSLASPTHRDVLKLTQALAPRIGVQILPIEARSAQEIKQGFSLMAKQNAQALIVLADSIFLERRLQIAELAVNGKLPCVGYNSGYGVAPISRTLF